MIHQVGQNVQEEDFINVEFKDKKTGEVTHTKRIRNNIFRDANIKLSWSRRKYLKLLEWFINKIVRHADNNMEHKRRFNLIHKIVKQMIVYRGIWFCERIIGKHMIKTIEDIPAESHNNHQRMFFDAWFKSNDDMWSLLIYKQGMMNPDKVKVEKHKSMYPTTKHYIEHLNNKGHKPYIARQMLAQLYMTEVIEDTADRTMNDCFMMRVAHSMMEFYGVKPEERNKVPKPGEYPIYFAGNEKNKNFFLSFVNIPEWYPLDSKEQKMKDMDMEIYSLKKQIEELTNKDKPIKVKKEVKKDES